MDVPRWALIRYAYSPFPEYKAANDLRVPDKYKNSPQIELWKMAESGATEQAAKFASEIENGLRTAKIVSSTDLARTASRPKLIKLENGLQGVWKKMEGDYTSGNAEIAAYLVDKKIGLNQVPITVERELDGVKGTLQIFVDGTDRMSLKNRPRFLTWFDDLIRNRDRHGGNYLTVQGRPVAIDHGLSFDHPDAFKDNPNFFANVRDVLLPLEKNAKKVKDVEGRIAAASSRHAGDSTRYERAMAELGPRLKAEKEKQKEALIIAQNKLAVMLPERSVYDKLKSIPDAEWEATFKGKLSKDQIKNFLNRKKNVVDSMDRVKDVFGENVFRDGVVSPLVRHGWDPTDTKGGNLREFWKKLFND